jgi:hypothetical protein
MPNIANRFSCFDRIGFVDGLEECLRFNLKDIPTRKLLRIYRDIDRIDDVIDRDWYDCDNSSEYDDPYLVKLAQLVSKIKAELSTREHVPNKLESRSRRQKRARRRSKKSKIIRYRENTSEFVYIRIYNTLTWPGTPGKKYIIKKVRKNEVWRYRLSGSVCKHF